MNALSILLPAPLFPSPTKRAAVSRLHDLHRSLSFYRRQLVHYTLPFRVSFKSPSSPLPTESHLSDADDEEEDDDDDYEVADEYEYISEDETDDEEEIEEDGAGDSVDLGNKEPKWQRIEKLCNLVKQFGKEMIDVDSLSDVYDFRVDKFQRLAIEAFLRGSSVVVSAPTSSGKTLIAESAAVATVARGKRLFYTTPLKALSNQKFREFKEAFGDNNVGLLTGDTVINREAPVLVLTTEILRNMLYQSVGKASSGSGLLHVDVIVLDEVHYLSDISRGTVWEEIVIYCPKDVQLICLSATVANPDELAGWIGQIHGKTELVTSSKRPVPLTWHFSTKTSLVSLLNEEGTGMNRKLSLNYLKRSALEAKNYSISRIGRRSSRKQASDEYLDDMSTVSTKLSKNDRNMIRRSQVPQVIDTLLHLKARDMLPAIWFIFNRRGCDAAVQYVENSDLLDDYEMSEVEIALKNFRLQYPDAVREPAVKGLLRGVAAHHAGCLPLWKSFIEELFQRGLVKVVFATETLAAGINMPARTAVISSLSKGGSSGRVSLSPNELLQMAGRAGRRGIDEQGHAVLLQTPYEGAEEGCKILFSGIEPLVSQFTASYGMVLNLLSGSKVTIRSDDTSDAQNSHAKRTLEEARKLVEQSFGNYLGSNVMQAAKDELAKIQKEIEALASDITDEAIDRKSRKILSKDAYIEIASLQEEFRTGKRLRTELRRKMEVTRLSVLKPLLKELENGLLPFICLQYKDSVEVEHVVPAAYLGSIESLEGSKVKEMVSTTESFAINLEIGQDVQPSYHVALGSDNSWYLFTEKWIATVYRTGIPDVPLVNMLPREMMKMILIKEEMQWEKLADAEFGGLWCSDGSMETWCWSSQVPVLSSLAEDDEVLQTSEACNESIERYKDQRKMVSRLKKRIGRTQGFREYKKIIDMAKLTAEKIKRLEARSSHLVNRIERIEPSGWKEFLQVSKVIHESKALDINRNVIFPLGETAAAIRGENELWLAMVLRNKILLDLKPPQLAAVCASLVSDGIKVRVWNNKCFIFEASSTVLNAIALLDEQRTSFIDLQEKHGVELPCGLDCQFAGMVEAWASGLSWRELMMDCAMDEGDLARLLRRTIDLLAQIPKLPDVNPVLRKNAVSASDVMDRSDRKSVV